MCRPSVIADDWVVKGCHIHIGGVELVLRPDHHGKIAFRKVFAGTSDIAAEAAIQQAEEVCLPDRIVRARWRRDLERAMEHMRGYEGELEALANGRQLEFRFLIRALDRCDNDGNT